MVFKLHRLSDYSDAALIEELQRVASIVPFGAISRAVFNKHSSASSSTLMKRFGGWEQALEKAGLGERYGGQPISKRMRLQPGRSISKDQVIKELKKVASTVGRQNISVIDFNSNASFSVATVRNHFKSWRCALEAAGLKPGQHSLRYSDEECFENLLHVWTHLGRPPKFREMNSPPSEVGGKAYISRWHTWIKALSAFVERVNNDDPSSGSESETPKEVMIKNTSKFIPEDDGRIRLGLRYRTLVRDNFKCSLCGNSPATDSTCRLHIDHIYPYSKGGTTTIENLSALCDACNIGKSNLTIEQINQPGIANTTLI